VNELDVARLRRDLEDASIRLDVDPAGDPSRLGTTRRRRA
jgi:hypothetical protein